MKNRIQVAFDLGSFSIKGAVGRIINDNQIEVLSIQSIKTDSIDTVSYTHLTLPTILLV